MGNMQEKEVQTSGKRGGHTQGPLVVGFYVPTPRFLAVREHVAVMKPTGELVALTGSTNNDEKPQSLADATLYAAASDLLAACERTHALIESSSARSATVDLLDRELVAVIAKARGGA